jgi:hypothetical protein
LKAEGQEFKMDMLTQWYDKLIDFAKQKLSVVLWFFISSAILLFTPNDYLKIIYIENSANIITGLIFLLSGVLLCINLVSSINIYLLKRGEKQQELKHVRRLLKQLEEFFYIEELKTGFESQQACITWGSKVAPLLKFNDQYYMKFMHSFNILQNMGISHQLGTSLLNTMTSQIEMAIYDLKQDISKLESK